MMTPEEQSLYQARQKRKNVALASVIAGFVALIFVITIFKFLVMT